MELKKPNALSIYGLFIPLNRQYKGVMGSTISIEFKDHSYWLLKAYQEQISWVLMELNKPNALSIYGLFI